MRSTRLGLMVITLAVIANTAFAQDEPRVGITMGYPASIGVVWHVTDGIALRPEVTATRSTNDLTATSVITAGGQVSTSSTDTTNDNWQVLFGVSGLFYLSKQEALKTYVSPRWAYTHVASTSTAGSTVASSSTGATQFVSGSFGAEYALGRRFAVFGELGVSYSHTTNSPNASTSLSTLFTTSTSNTLGTRSGAGVIFYF